MFLPLLLIFVAAFASPHVHSSASPSSPHVYNRTLFALLVLKASIDPPGLLLSSWNTSTSPDFCTWLGITCFPPNSHQVTRISLRSYYYSLNGTLSPQIGNLQELITLDLSYNLLYGQLPSSLGQMKSLQYLDLSGNHFSGPLPSSLGQMESLQHLALSGNQFSGSLPSSLGHMESLQYLYLFGNHFSGPLPSSLGHMKSLQYLVFSRNNFSGPLPSSLWQMKSLLYLDLSANQFFGSLPSSLGQMKSLTNLYLSANNFSGPLPSSLGQMKSLQYLDLSLNNFSGPLPSSLDSVFNLNFLNVSYNRLQGSIPSRLYQQFSPDCFQGNPGLHGPTLFRSRNDHNDHTQKNPGLHGPPLFRSRNDHTRSIIVEVVCATAGSVISCLLVSFCVWRYCCKNKDPGLDFVAPQYKAWTAEEMRVATNNFDAANVIGSGAASMCYLGTMKSPEGSITRVVALKRLTVDECEEGVEADEARESFVNEFKTLCKVRHRNLVKVLGYCVEGRENIALVMEYMERGDLDRRLHRNIHGARKLSWEERVNVALDVAEGLVYLHHEYEQPIIHCDVKPKNILLGADMVAKISDFGIARLVQGKDQRGDMSMSRLRGTFGYIAPEYGMGLRISTKVDVYSYGMLLLELVTGVRPTSLMLENKAMNLRTWVQTLQTAGQIRDVLQENDLATLQEAKEILRLGVQCTHDVAKERPTMYIVRDFILQLKKSRVQNEPSLFVGINYPLNN